MFSDRNDMDAVPEGARGMRSSVILECLLEAPGSATLLDHDDSSWRSSSSRFVEAVGQCNKKRKVCMTSGDCHELPSASAARGYPS